MALKYNVSCLQYAIGCYMAKAAVNVLILWVDVKELKAGTG